MLLISDAGSLANKFYLHYNSGHTDGFALALEMFCLRTLKNISNQSIPHES